MEYSPRYRRLRRLLRKMRKEAGLSQTALAEKLHKPQSFVCKAELGERSLDIFQTVDICEACGVAPETFVALLLKSAANNRGKQERRGQRKVAPG